MTSHHVTCHVTAVSRASSLSKRKIKEMRKYKIRKIKEKKNKIISVQVSHNTYHLTASDIHTFSLFQYKSCSIPITHQPKD